jgi:membrane-associated protease RseP (regulator of RpoE activity)
VEFSRKRFSLCLFFASVAIPVRARAELPPGAYEKLLGEAQEVYRLKITTLDEQPGDTSGVRHYKCDAEILSVERSKADRKPGEKIRFATYYVPPEVSRRGFAGPKSPPLLTVGWEGRVYLNPPRQGDVLELAAYGRSFVPSANRTPAGAQAPRDKAGGLGITIRGSSQGGLEILTVRRDSLADDLGLRPGDRLVKVNGQPVAAPADVRAAVDSDMSRLTVNLVRKQKSVEVAIER